MPSQYGEARPVASQAGGRATEPQAPLSYPTTQGEECNAWVESASLSNGAVPTPAYADLAPHISAMLGASGLNEQQAKTCVFYALATHHIDKFEKFPILVFQGGADTGKSSAMAQAGKMCQNPKEVVIRPSEMS